MALRNEYTINFTEQSAFDTAFEDAIRKAAVELLLAQFPQTVYENSSIFELAIDPIKNGELFYEFGAEILAVKLDQTLAYLNLSKRLTPIEEIYLTNLLREHQAQVPHFNKNQAYHLESFPVPTCVMLSHDATRRSRKEGKSGLRYDKACELLGKGGFGYAMSSDVTFGLNAEGQLDISYKNPEQNERALKYINLDRMDEKPLIRIKRESEMNFLYGNRAKHAVFFGNYGCFAMRRAPGIELFKLLNCAIKKTYVVSLSIRLLICEMIALKLHDFHNRGGLHRDIKLENVLIKLIIELVGKKKRVIGVQSVDLVDFGLSRKIDQTKAIPFQGGTVPYISPEAAYAKETSTASDVYSFGWLCSFVLDCYFPTLQHSDQSAYFRAIMAFAQTEMTPLSLLHHNKRQKSLLLPNESNKLSGLITSMTRFSPENRGHLPDIAETFRQIRLALEERMALAEKVGLTDTLAAAEEIAPRLSM